MLRKHILESSSKCQQIKSADRAHLRSIKYSWEGTVIDASPVVNMKLYRAVRNRQDHLFLAYISRYTEIHR